MRAMNSINLLVFIIVIQILFLPNLWATTITQETIRLTVLFFRPSTPLLQPMVNNDLISEKGDFIDEKKGFAEWVS